MKLAFVLVLFAILPQFVFAQFFEIPDSPINHSLFDSRSVNFIDINNDGWEDIFISNGLQGGQADLLYINDGAGKFIQNTQMEIVKSIKPSDGASFADYNNDGFVDGIVSSWYGAEDLLYLNDGHGQLTYNASGGLAAGSFAETAAFGDYDGDGWLDLYVTNSAGGKQNYLYKNQKNGQFERITDHLITQEKKPSRGAIWGDFNGDGILDLFVANEGTHANDIYYGLGNGDFEKLIRGGIVIKPNSSMTGSWGDIDNDGDFDLFVGNAGYFKGQPNQLFEYVDGRFQEILDSPIQLDSKCTFGSAFGDVDNDGDLDLAIANGFCDRGMSNQLFFNDGTGHFIDSSSLLPSNFNICSFGLAWGDVNNDGFLDLVVANCKNGNDATEQRNTLMINQGNENHWIDIRLVGVVSNKDGIGAKVRVKARINERAIWQTREIRSQSGYAGQNSIVAHFGLGDASLVDSIVIVWPSGIVQVLASSIVDQRLEILEVVTTSNSSNTLTHITVRTFPNPIPVEDTLRIDILNQALDDKVNLQLYNALGVVIWKAERDIQTGKNRLEIDLKSINLNPGAYLINVQTELGRVGKKILLID